MTANASIHRKKRIEVAYLSKPVTPASKFAEQGIQATHVNYNWDDLLAMSQEPR
jgi:hypothetical protein